ncbi:MAG: NUDIX hydrolase [Patescibacteria group bacterium]
MINCTFENGHKASLRHVVVDAICLKDNKILLVKRSNKILQSGKYALPGGFLNLDETTKEATLRELKEETGYNGKIVKLIKVLDDPKRKNEDRQNVSFIYQIEVGEKVGESDDETKSVHWFPLNHLPEAKDFAFDHYEIIQFFLNSR